MTTGTKIRYFREKKKLSQEELAHLVGVSQVTIGNWEQGKSIKHEFIRKLAMALEVSTDFLLEEVQNSNVQAISDKQTAGNDFEIIIKAPNHLFDDLNKKMDFIINRFGNVK
ncbi:helix-turn-helix domain-containing protein [Flavobacterium wongokense]|uniref:helix-turn-helix domain-containing protein n=1 Tax=Flavobacterium wongokense TaxID=2910674 RepID=UPI001F2B23BA|nr:helix-turn-helix transcriptional regulator [Flavobacterium sp. WG47]MCF6132379.1 helix-turn-helix domain-containing protein [Flavobacterium sp. WG47]